MTRRPIAVEARDVEALRGTIDRLRLELSELRASRKRIVLATDAHRRATERDLHDGIQQDLVALAVSLQLARRLVDADPAAAKALLDELGGDVQRALDETARLAERIHPPLLEAGGLAAALRSAAVGAGVRLSVEGTTPAACPPEVATAIYVCFLEVLERSAAGARATVSVRGANGELTFDLAGGGDLAEEAVERLRDRVEALGGRLTTASEPGRGTRLSSSLPLPE